MRHEIIVDGHSLYARSYFAAVSVPDPSFTAQGGVTQLGINSICSIFKKLDPTVTHGLICWDNGSKTDKKRGAKPGGYRTILAEEFAPTLRAVFNFAETSIEGYEADDMVATAALAAAKSDQVEAVTVVSGDKDLAQLLGGKVAYWSLNEKSLLSPTYVCKKFEIKHASHLPVALAILGDPVDNVPGVHKWGISKLRKIFADLTPEATILEAAEHAASFMNPAQLVEFETSLAVTLLNSSIEGISSPAPLTFNAESLFTKGWAKSAAAVQAMAFNQEI